MAQPISQVASDPQLVHLRVPPHSIEAEQSVLRGLLLDNQAWERVADILAESNFYRDCHRRIYRHIGTLIGTLRSPWEVEAWRDWQRTLLQSAINDGPVLIQ